MKEIIINAKNIASCKDILAFRQGEDARFNIIARDDADLKLRVLTPSNRQHYIVPKQIDKYVYQVCLENLTEAEIGTYRFEVIMNDAKVMASKYQIYK